MTKTTHDNSFLRTVQEYRKGELLTDLSAAMREVCEAVERTKKPGKIVLEVLVTPSGEAYTYRPEVSIKLPKQPKPGAIFFMDEQHNLVREDPRQRSMEFTVVEGKQPETTIAEAAKAVK